MSARAGQGWFDLVRRHGRARAELQRPVGAEWTGQVGFGTSARGGGDRQGPRRFVGAGGAVLFRRDTSVRNGQGWKGLERRYGTKREGQCCFGQSARTGVGG
jgi:hypothetical protein